MHQLYMQHWGLGLFFVAILHINCISGASLSQGAILREARLILPQEDNAGNSSAPIKDKLEYRLLASFGGFTGTEGIGGWESGSQPDGTRLKVVHEPVWIYDIGCVDNEESETELMSIALWIKETANQESVYLRLPSGHVVFV